MSESAAADVDKSTSWDKKVTQRRQGRRIKNGASSVSQTKPVIDATAPRAARRTSAKRVDDALLEQRAFAANLIRLRLAAGLTQDELAAKSGISQSNISALENSTWEPRLSTIFALARAFGVAPATLVPGWDRG